MWGREVNGLTLTFHLAGINNQNFLMRDEETGSYWQQISGLAIAGPLSGKSLKLIPADELSLDLWKAEQPQGTFIEGRCRVHVELRNARLGCEDAESPDGSQLRAAGTGATRSDAGD